MEFDYEQDTKNHYQSVEVAEKYHAAFAQEKGLYTIRFRAIAYRERNIVSRFLKQIPHERILDLPSGTGKLVPVFQELGARITACDISEEMLAIARKEYRKVSHENVEFIICDAEEICETLNDHFNVAVCLRLLHRVPEIKLNSILGGLAEVADYSIISLGIENPYHRVRRFIRMLLLGGRADMLCYQPINMVREKLGNYFEIMRYAWVIPGLSQEIIFLLRSRDKTIKSN